MRDWLLAAGSRWCDGEHRHLLAAGVCELEGHFDLIVGNAQHMKNVPGRKSDVKDCEWISDLARHGLIAHSFVPPRRIRDLRDLTRYRRKLSQAQAAERNRLIKLLESANIKLAGCGQQRLRRVGPGDAECVDRGRGDAGRDGATRPAGG